MFRSLLHVLSFAILATFGYKLKIRLYTSTKTVLKYLFKPF